MKNHYVFWLFVVDNRVVFRERFTSDNDSRHVAFKALENSKLQSDLKVHPKLSRLVQECKKYTDNIETCNDM